jgi:hypothetical protein
MPFRIFKIPNSAMVTVLDKGRIISKSTTPENAKKQIRLIRAEEQAWTPNQKSPIEKP